MPRTVKWDPYPYQLDFLEHLHGGAESLGFVEMGLGKTATVLTFINDIVQEDRRQGKERRWLVLAPLRVVRTVWRQEVQKWDHLKYLNIDVAVGTPLRRLEVLTDKWLDVVVMNYENLTWLCDQFAPGTLPFYGLVMDEVDRMKAHNTNRFKSFRYRAHEFAVRVGMGGTIASESLQNTWGPTYLVTSRPVVEGKLGRQLPMTSMLGGSFYGFVQKYFMPEHPRSHKLIPRSEEVADKIAEIIAPITFQARVDDHLDLPPYLYQNVYYDIPPKARAKYDEMEKTLVVEVDEKRITAANAAVKVNKLRQMCSGFIYHQDFDAVERETEWFHDAKLHALSETIENLNGAQHLLSYGFLAEVERCAFPHRLGSGLSEDDEADLLQRWVAGEIPQLAFHPKSASHGLNLHEGGAHHIIHMTLPWSQDQYAQTNARLRRMGQKKVVVVHRLIARDSIEEDVLTALGTKGDVQKALFAALKRRHSA